MEDVDLFIAGLMETRTRGGGRLGHTFSCIIADQVRTVFVYWVSYDKIDAVINGEKALNSSIIMYVCVWYVQYIHHSIEFKIKLKNSSLDSCLLVQMRRAKVGDRYFFSSPNTASQLSAAQVAEVEKVTLARVLCANTQVETLELTRAD